jgi:RNA polymerase sigma-70 factor (ECF subfamily)
MTGREFETLLHSAKAGDERALGALYRELNPLLRRFFTARAYAAVDDLTQDTWLSVAEGIERFEGDALGFRSWIFTIAYRRLADHHRRSSRRLETAAEPEALLALAPGFEPLDRAAMEEALHALIDGLSVDQADIVLLRIVGGLDVDQVAAIVGKTPGAVRVAQHRALQRLAGRVVPEPAAS